MDLYIGFFDIAKAFDHVSRYLLLKKLVVMLKALQMSYSQTLCIVSVNNKYSNEFITFSGISRGATSSASLFITFMDDLVKYLKATCEFENFLKDLHTLLHADDTVILSSFRAKFIDKCNSMISFFNSNRLSLNIGKSGYMIVSKKSVNTAKQWDIKIQRKL